MKLDGLKALFDNSRITTRIETTVSQNSESAPQNGGTVELVNNFTFTGRMIQTRLAQTETGGTTQIQALTTTEQGEIDTGISAVLDHADLQGEASIELANQLRGKSPEYQAEFMRRLYEQFPEFTTELLATAGGRPPHQSSDTAPSESDTYVIAQALGNAYDAGVLGDDFIRNLINPENFTASFSGEYQHYLGLLVGESGSREMKEAFYNEAMRIVNESDSEVAPYYISGAANALAGDPELLQEKLAEMNANGTLEQFLSDLDPANFSGSTILPEHENAYANLVRSAAHIQPPTEEVAKLFQITGEKYMTGDYVDRYGMADAMTALYTGGNTEYVRLPNGKVDGTIFHSNAEFFMLKLSTYGTQADGSIADPTDILALSNFFAATAFNDESPNRDLVTAVTQRELAKLQTAIENYPSVGEPTKGLIESSTYVNPDSNESPQYQVQEQLAFRFGRILGGVFQGFEIAVQNRNADNAAIDSAVDMLFSIIPVDKVTDVIGKIPGASAAGAVGLGPDALVDYGKQALKDWLHETDLNENREEVYTTLMNLTGTLYPDLYDEFSGGYNDVAGIVRDLTDK